MAKRHHSSKRHMGHHSPMPNVVSKMEHGEHYASRGASDKLRMHDSGMIHEDHNQPALLPSHVIDKYWDRGHYSAPTGIVDLYSGAQKRLKEDAGSLHRETELGNYY